MQDRLADILKLFRLQAQVFQAGPICDGGEFAPSGNTGYLHVLTAGAIEVSSGGELVRLLEPSVLLYMRPQAHRVRVLQADTSMLCARFEFGDVTSNPLRKAFAAPFQVALSSLPQLERLLQVLYTEAEEEHCGRQAVLDRLMEVLLIQLLRDAMDTQRLESGLLAGLADPKLSRALTAMHQDVQRPWTLAELAQQAAMSRARFAERFHAVLGVTPGAYLNDWRLSVAREMLLQGKPVQWVSDAVGYGSASAFSRVFKARAGETPMQWLKRQRK
jgi:AraC-like DNA-binding protein